MPTNIDRKGKTQSTIGDLYRVTTSPHPGCHTIQSSAHPFSNATPWFSPPLQLPVTVVIVSHQTSSVSFPHAMDLHLHLLLFCLCIIPLYTEARPNYGMCPELRDCSCHVFPRGLEVNCAKVPDVRRIPQDLRRLQGHRLATLAFLAVDLKTIPAFYFANLTIPALKIASCMLESLDDEAFVDTGPMQSLDMSNNHLATIPGALRALNGLQELKLSHNRIKVINDELAHLAPTLKVLWLNNNLIERIDKDSLRNFNNLVKVDLSKNSLRSIQPLFKGLQSLMEIDLKYNAIQHVDSAFTELPALQTLKLTGNNITSTEGLTSPSSPALRVLWLDQNPIASISEFSYNALVTMSIVNCRVLYASQYAFAYSPELKYLDLSSNRMSFIPGTAFHEESKLIRLKAIENSIFTLEGTFNATRQLQVIVLSGNKIREISDVFTGLARLLSLNLNGNRIESIADMTFETNRNLKTLSLNENRIEWLGKDAFRGLGDLEELFLNDNRLTTLNGSFSYMPELRSLYLDHNQLTRIRETDFVNVPLLSYVGAANNHISDVRGAFKYSGRLGDVVLEDNRLHQVHRASFPDSFANASAVRLKGNPLQCDCQLTWLLPMVQRKNPLWSPTCSGPPWLSGLSLLNVSASMLRDSPEDCDPSCSCTCKPDDRYGKSTHVDCSKANLTRTPDVFPSDASVVDLSGNDLRTLGSSLVDGAPHLEALVLSDNSFSELSVKEIPKSLKSLDLRNNSFTRFPRDVVAGLNLTSLWLAGNEWICDCESYAFKLWAQVNDVLIQDGALTICGDGSIAEVRGKAIINLGLWDLCSSAASWIVFAVSAFVLLIIILSAAMICMKRSRQIKVWLFARGLLCVQENDVDKDKVFDIFLSFSSKDSDWAYANLVPRIESEGFSVCTYDRNFKGGFLLQDIIQEAVSCSRRTLLLLTQNFVESEWCRWEFRVAHHNALRERINRLIVVVTEDIPDDVDEELLVYMKATCYLRWGERNFWNKLMYSLPRKSCNAERGSVPLSIIAADDARRILNDLRRLRGHRLSTLVFVGVDMKTIPAFYFANLTIPALRIASCSLESLDDEAFVDTGPMQSLDMSNNHLTTIPGALRELNGLQILTLSHNRIKIINDELAHLAPTLKELWLNNNLIDRIHKDSLRNFNNLSKVDLSNNSLRSIQPIFEGLQSLEEVDLQYNAIQRVGSTFTGLPALQKLELSGNNITSVEGLTLTSSPALRHLWLDYNPIANITAFNYNALLTISVQNCRVSHVSQNAFANSPKLKYLYLSSNNISFIPGTAFHEQSELLDLKAMDNSITTLEGTFNATRRIQKIVLAGNKIREISNAFTALARLLVLNLNRNRIESIADMTFETNRNLKDLHLYGNRIEWLGKDAFRGLDNLATLVLDGNRLKSLNGSLSYMPELRHLFLDNNRLTRIGERDFVNAPHLRNIRAKSNSIIDVRGAFKHLESLQSVVLEENSLRQLHRASFPDSIAKDAKVYLQGNPLQCDCQLTWLLPIVHRSSLKNLTCDGPSWLAGLSLLNVPASTLRDSPEDCDPGCSCTCKPDNRYGKSTHVDCSKANLTRTPDVFPRDASVVDLSGNDLRTLGSSLVDGAPHLEALVLSDNSFSELSVKEIPKSLKSLDLRNNSFTKFPTDVVVGLKLTSLWLAGNEWICDCDSYDFKLWTQVNDFVIHDSNLTICADGSVPEAHGKAIVNLVLSDLCPSAAWKIVFAVPAFALLIVVLSATMIYLKRSRQIKVWLFARGLLCVQENDVDKDKAFDVFLSFSSKDSDWAYANLVPRIEGEGFSVCTYDRNFKGGFLLQDIIQEAVSCSRRTLLLLTQNFVESEWCRWEFRVAHCNALRERINRLIVVVTEDIPDDVDKELLVYMKATCYLRWGERNFWNKLMCSLPRTNLDLKTIPAFYFANLTTSALKIASCMLESLDDEAFVGTGPMQSLDMSNNNLTTIPGALRALNGLQELKLSHNRIKAINDELAHLAPTLKELWLNNNLIERIDKDPLRNFSELPKVEDLSNNHLRSSEPLLLKGLQSLVERDVGHDAIRHVGPTFRKLPALRILKLSGNNITSVEGLTLTSSPAQRQLWLDDNPIANITVFSYNALLTISVRNCSVSHVSQYAFAYSTELRYLYLSRNNISFIPGTAFHEESKLILMRASENSITTLEGTFNATRLINTLVLWGNKIRDISNAFTTLELLVILNLSRNRIESIADMTFETNRNLKILYLNENRIEWLGKDAFRGLHDLEVLLLNGNRLTTLNGSLSHMPRLQSVHLENNQLTRIGERDFVSVPHLRNISAKNNSIIDVRGAFKHLGSLGIIVLEENLLRQVHRATFPDSIAKGAKVYLQARATERRFLMTLNATMAKRSRR
ncbi:uncharacterized protein LOC135399730 [Ornithodoros turicata]|uniref:uncharacterized protein LOC135399730 n=1 Tax=Ornithodoros turicata TaxID=34597 RepID=UPI00313977E5